MATIWDYESVVSRRARRQYGRGWTRRVIFGGVPSEIAESLVPLEGTPYPGESGNQAAVLMDSDVELDSIPRKTGGNLARITLYYWPRTCDEWLEAHPNKAILIPKAGIFSYKARVHNGTIIEGPDHTDRTGRSEWKVTSHTANTVFRPRVIYEVYAVVSDRGTYCYHYVTKVGSYNKGIMMSFPLWPEPSRRGQWLLTRLSCVPRKTVQKLYTMRYAFMLNMDTELGWADPCISTKFEVKFVERPVVDINKEETGETRVTATLLPTTETNSVVLLDEADFFDINNMLLYSW